MKRLILALALIAVPASADIDVVRRNYIDYYTAAGAPRSSERMQKSLSEIEWAAGHFSQPGWLLSDGSWTDINYLETPSGVWSPSEHVRRVWLMTKAYRTAGPRHHGDPAKRDHIETALSKEEEFYGAWVIPTGNWWYWTIGVPLELGPALVLMRGDIDAQLYDDLVLAIAWRIGSSPASRGLVGPVPTGQNLVWSSFNHLSLALLRDDSVQLSRVRDAMAGVTLPTTGEGVKSDRSFHQHGAQLYTGGYGGSFAYDVAKYALLTRGSAYALPPESMNSFFEFLTDGIAWSLHGSVFDIDVVEVEGATGKHYAYSVNLLMRRGDQKVAVGVRDDVAGESSFVSRTLRVGTQVANVPSLRLYENCGFRVAESAYVLHGHLA